MWEFLHYEDNGQWFVRVFKSDGLKITGHLTYPSRRYDTEADAINYGEQAIADLNKNKDPELKNLTFDFVCGIVIGLMISTVYFALYLLFTSP